MTKRTLCRIEIEEEINDYGRCTLTVKNDIPARPAEDTSKIFNALNALVVTGCQGWGDVDVITADLDEP